MKIKTIILTVLLVCCPGWPAADATIKALVDEMNRSFKVLSRQQPVPVYFLQYEIWDEHEVNIAAALGAVTYENDDRHRYLDVDIRVGSSRFDNTHQTRGGGEDESYWRSSEVAVPIDDNPDALRATLWIETDRRFKSALERYVKVRSERQVKVLESDTSADFSPAPNIVWQGPETRLELDAVAWREKIKLLAARFKAHPWIYYSSVTLRGVALTKHLVNTENTRISDGYRRYTLRVNASTMAEDGMELHLGRNFYAATAEGLPATGALASQIDSLIANLEALRNAPLVEPFSGPAILVNRACGVFFHEIFGHRVEGHRQKSEHEGQTFTKKVNEQIMPDFISIDDDPTMRVFDGRDLNGFYRFDDEGVAAQRAVIVENGVLRGFLTSRSPIAGFPRSNGHGRRSYGRQVVSRQGVLYIKSVREMPFDRLREELVAECKKQNKPYGFVFYDIAGGYTMTGRDAAQTFKVIPLLVKRVFVDGRPDEVVRGVDIVGTPLASLAKILMTGNDYDIFNGTCGAESGWVPVSAIAPSILVSEIEIEKKPKGQTKPPILKAPFDGPRTEVP